MADAKTKDTVEGWVIDAWVLVPRDPTPEMVQAAWDEAPEGAAIPTYRAMLAAAPQPASVALQPAASDVPHDVVRALEEALELLQEKRHGNPARSPGHNAQHAIKRALDALATPAPSTSTEEALRQQLASDDGLDCPLCCGSGHIDDACSSMVGKGFLATLTDEQRTKALSGDFDDSGVICTSTEEALTRSNSALINDTVLMGLARDEANTRAEALRAENARLQSERNGWEHACRMSWETSAEKDGQNARLREELACTLDELIDHNGDDMIDSRQKRADELRATTSPALSR